MSFIISCTEHLVRVVVVIRRRPGRRRGTWRVNKWLNTELAVTVSFTVRAERPNNPSLSAVATEHKSVTKQKPEQYFSVSLNNSDFLYHFICQWQQCSSLQEGRRSNTNVLSQFRSFSSAKRIVCAPCGFLCRDVQYLIPPDAVYRVGWAHRLTVTHTHTHTHTHIHTHTHTHTHTNKTSSVYPVEYNLTTTGDSPTNNLTASQLFRKLSLYTLEKPEG